MNFDYLKDQISNLTLYDVKAAVRKAQNVVMNYTEMEAKVREATNNEPWGASSTLMQEIANGTYNYQLLTEIMPMIYKRFTEKSADEWRQIYKALQLLEFLVKNGSEQVVDDARGHVSTIKMLRQFHYIDVNGKDQGVNVRNRAKELAELLSDVDRIRAERKKARAAKNKYGGVEGGLGSSSHGGFSGGSSSGRKYGGFGSDGLEYGGFSGGVYGDGGGFGGTSSSREYNDDSNGGYRTSSGSQRFEEYDEYDEADAPSNRAGLSKATTSSQAKKNQAPAPKPAEEKKEPQPVKDLLSLDDEVATTSSTGNSGNIIDDFGGLKGSTNNEEDEFDDFQSAGPAQASGAGSKLSSILSSLPNSNQFNAAKPVTTQALGPTTFAAPQPRSAGQAANISELVTMTTPNLLKSPYSPPPTAPPGGSMGTLTPQITTGYQALKPNVQNPIPAQTTFNSSARSDPSAPSTSNAAKPASAKQDAFGSIWNAASSGLRKSSSTPPANSVPMAAMAKEKASAGIWGGSTTPKSMTPTSSVFGNSGLNQSNSLKGSHGLDDLLG